MHVHFKIVALSGESMLGRLWSGTLVPSITLHFLASPVTWCKCSKMWTSVISGVWSILYIFLKLQVNKERRERLSAYLLILRLFPGVLTLRPPWVDGNPHINPTLLKVTDATLGHHEQVFLFLFMLEDLIPPCLI